ncbi:MAG: VapC toxin family PIN domain ribonuclease [Fimbriimonadaceae bacterium]
MNGKCALLDSNVLIALATPAHQHYVSAQGYVKGLSKWAYCPITQGALLRFYYREAVRPSVKEASRILASIAAISVAEFIPDSQSFDSVSMEGITGHNQVTDAYLVHLARGSRANACHVRQVSQSQVSGSRLIL